MAGDISQETLKATGIALIAVTTMIMLARLVGGLANAKQRKFSMEDFWMVFCYLCFVTLAVLYIYIVPAYERVVALSEGLIEPYATAEDDAVFIQKALFAVTLCLWSCLWACKFSLLSMYKKLMTGIKLYEQLWWALAIFTSLAFFGCVVTLFTACSSMYAWFSAGNCYTPRDIFNATISLWFSYSVDVLTDLLVMFLPVRLIMGLQMPLSRKLSVGSLFALGFVCIIASTLRATQISNGSQQPTVPWLALWGTIEASIAVIISTAPGLYRIIKLHTSREQYYVDDSSLKTRNNRSRTNPRMTDKDMKMMDYPQSTVIRAESSSSQEGLVYPDEPSAIRVTKAVRVEHGMK